MVFAAISRLWVNTWAYLRRLEELSLTTSDDLRRAGALERVGGLVALERLRVVEVEHCAEAGGRGGGATLCFGVTDLEEE